MKVLYLIYAPFSSLEEFVNKGRTGFTWVDSMIDEIIKHDRISIGLAVPVKSGTFQKEARDGMVFYGLPDYLRKNRLRDYLKRLSHKQIETDINTYTLGAIEDFNPDIIQIFGTENPFGKVVHLTNRKIIIHFQGCLQVVAAKWFSAISKYEQFIYSSLKDFLLLRGIFHEYFVFRSKVAVEKEILRKCRYFVGRTDFDKRLISFLAPQARYFFCNEFIRNEFLNNRWNKPLGETVTCISVLKGVSYKGLDVLFELPGILKEYLSIEIRFKICGIREDEEYVKVLKRKYRGRIDLAKFDFLGILDTKALLTNLSNSDLFLHPSYVENSSNSICEAMAIGMPVIATNAGGTISLINDGVDGLIVQEGEPNSMAAAIAYLLQDHNYAKEIGRNAKLKSLLRHNPETVFNELLRIYETVTTVD